MSDNRGSSTSITSQYACVVIDLEIHISLTLCLTHIVRNTKQFYI